MKMLVLEYHMRLFCVSLQLFLLLHSDQDTTWSRDWNSSLKIKFPLKFLGSRDREKGLETKSEPPVGVARTGVGENSREDKPLSIE